ncbi:translation initiation factor IF-2-like [Phocoena sinus]|uniref:translation initiation factor IF-2-like n=1 Tax=Phocoena sinus TaxID=42100 RepID=UPI0013C4B703|nr:translation initiation factor IF-2-like [Phocoena sinus]
MYILWVCKNVYWHVSTTAVSHKVFLLPQKSSVPHLFILPPPQTPDVFTVSIVLPLPCFERIPSSAHWSQSGSWETVPLRRGLGHRRSPAREHLHPAATQGAELGARHRRRRLPLLAPHLGRGSRGCTTTLFTARRRPSGTPAPGTPPTPIPGPERVRREDPAAPRTGECSGARGGAPGLACSGVGSGEHRVGIGPGADGAALARLAKGGTHSWEGAQGVWKCAGWGPGRACLAWGVHSWEEAQSGGTCGNARGGNPGRAWSAGMAGSGAGVGKYMVRGESAQRGRHRPAAAGNQQPQSGSGAAKMPAGAARESLFWNWECWGLVLGALEPSLFSLAGIHGSFPNKCTQWLKMVI